MTKKKKSEEIVNKDYIVYSGIFKNGKIENILSFKGNKKEVLEFMNKNSQKNNDNYFVEHDYCPAFTLYIKYFYYLNDKKGEQLFFINFMRIMSFSLWFFPKEMKERKEVSLTEITLINQLFLYFQNKKCTADIFIVYYSAYLDKLLSLSPFLIEVTKDTVN